MTPYGSDNRTGSRFTARPRLYGRRSLLGHRQFMRTFVIPRPIHKMTMTSFAITFQRFYGHSCRRHVVGQRIVSDFCVVRSCCGICSPCSETCYSVATTAHCCTWNVCFDLHTKYTLPYNMATYKLVTADRKFNDVTAPYLYIYIFLQHG